MIRIVEIGDIAWQGKTEPVICRAEDGREYVVVGAGDSLYAYALNVSGK